MTTKLSSVRTCAIALFLLLGSAITALGCSCAENPTVDKEFAAAKNVVLLKADSYLGSFKSQADADDRVSGFNFIVQRVFKGNILKLGERVPMISTGMCSFGFEASDLGREFLVYYFSDDQLSVVPACTRSGPAEYRAADIKYLENIGKVGALTRISGLISQKFRASTEGEISRTVPLSNHSVRITGQGRSVRAETDINGVFEAYGLPPGNYRVQPEKLEGFVPTDSINRTTESANVTLPTNGHAEVNFYFDVDNTISGTLLSADGKPIHDVRLDLVPAHGRPAKYFVETAYPDKHGMFKFERIPPGTYVIIGNRDNRITADYPYPQFYSSGTGDRATAQEITIRPGDSLKGFVVRAPRPVETVNISGALRFSDGSPVSTGTVKFVTGNGEDRLPGDAYAYPDKSGKFTLKVLKGQKGVIFGYVPLNSWVFRGCPDRLKGAQLEAERSGVQLPETPRTTVESASEMSGINLNFTFTLCSEK